MDNAPSQLDLIQAARAVQRAATAEDIDTLHDEMCRVRNALVEHARDQGLDGVSHRIVPHGEHRLLHFIDELLSTTHEGSESCACLVRTTELRSMLVRQLLLEARTTRR